MPIAISPDNGPSCHGVPQGGWMEAAYPFNLGTTSLATCFAMVVFMRDESTMLAHVHATVLNKEFLTDIQGCLAKCIGIHIVHGQSGFSKLTAVTAKTIVKLLFPGTEQEGASSYIDSATIKGSVESGGKASVIKAASVGMYAVYPSNGSVVYAPKLKTMYLGAAVPVFLNQDQYNSNKLLAFNKGITQLIAWDLPD